VWLRAFNFKGFRNLLTPALEFDARANYFFGSNATGKTSLLEAIHYLAIGRSFRPALDKDVVQFGSAVFQLQGEASTASAPPETRRGEIRGDGQTKKLFLDGIEIDRLSAYLGWLPIVTLLLDDIRLVRGGPTERRAFLDLALSKVSRPYLLALSEYRRVLIRRNRVLSQTPSEALLATWDDQLVNAGDEVYRLRHAFLPGLLRAAGEIAAGLSVTADHRSSAGTDLRFSYRSSVNHEGELRGNFLAALRSGRAREQALGVTLSGPHRDDIIIQKTQRADPEAKPDPGRAVRSGEPSEFRTPHSAPRTPDDVSSTTRPFDCSTTPRELRRFGSEGEQRTASIALKLAEARLLREQRQEAPLFLLDEIASELDSERSRRLFALLESQGQIFYAAAKPIPASGKVFSVAAGEIVAQ
jgi:DNA replication and repair protein RecF